MADFGEIFADGQARNLSADNPDEYAKIIEENFGISYPEKFQRNFRDFTLEIAKAISKGESG